MSNGKPKKKRRQHPLVAALLVFLSVVRILLFPALLLFGIGFGLYVGYVEFGDGRPDDVFRWETWKHVLDLVFAE